jgi:ribosomal protein S9
MGHQVRSRVAVNFQTFGSGKRHQAQATVFLDGEGRIDQNIVKIGRHGLPRQALADAAGNLQRGRATGDFSGSSVR